MPLEFPTFEFAWQGCWPRYTTRAQQRALLRLIATAAEQRLPLVPLLEAHERDERGIQKYRLRLLLRALKNQTPLVDAVEQIVGILDDEDVLAIRFGYQSGAVAAAIRDRLAAEPMTTPRVEVELSKSLFYVGVLILLALPAALYLQFVIAPQMEQILAEFRLEAAPTVRMVQSLFRGAMNYWWLLLVVPVGAIGLLASSHFARYVRREAAGAQRPVRNWRVAAILDKLSVATASGRPLPGVISTLARYHYDPRLRHKLLYVRNELEQGASLWSTLVAAQLLTPAEVKALDTADRLGNRGWVLEQIAHCRKERVRRTLERTAPWLTLLLILALGAFVLLQCLAMMLSLTALTMSLT